MNEAGASGVHCINLGPRPAGDAAEPFALELGDGDFQPPPPRLKFLPVGQITVAVGGTKVLANASKPSAVSYQRAGELIGRAPKRQDGWKAPALPKVA